MILTRDDMIRSGACFNEVQAFCERHDLYVAEVDELLRIAKPSEVPYIKRAAEIDGYGDGYGNGYGYGYG